MAVSYTTSADVTPLDPEEKAAFDRQMDEVDRQVLACYGSSGPRATPEALA
ncbi:hypothetical protein ACN27G_01055 [Plantactinospora sp. WMMB334]|uniref:hypothetical protein n=1 Tax=Plantactinospora sp. WMMB334 TaxID=3404119 RepID=UPI003B96738E